jgi:hypothetical protein
MTYTINGKEWTKSNINERCAVLMGIEYQLNDIYVMVSDTVASIETGVDEFMEYCPCYNPSDTDAIIDKCFDELNKVNVSYDSIGRMITSTKWNSIMIGHDCSKLIAACICYIEINEAAL